MKFEQLAKLLFKSVRLRLERHGGLSIFASERSKFEGWLKVELCDVLMKSFDNIVPEQNRVDVCCGNWMIELKTINTNLKYKNTNDKTRPITKNTEGVIEDIKKLKRCLGVNKSVLFIVFPARHDNKHWLNQLERIKKYLVRIKHREFNFANGVPGIIYFGLI